MRDLIADFNTWLRTKLKKRNKRFKATSFQIYETPEGKYSGAVICLLTINTIVFLVLWVLEFTPFYDVVVQHFIAPADMHSLSSRWWTILICGFTHQSFIHFAMNMMGLVMIAQPIKSLLSNKQVWFVYITTVLLGSIAGIAYANIVQSTDILAVSTIRGASAGVLGLITVFVMQYPNMRINLFIVPTTLKWLAYINIIYSITMVIFNINGGGGAAHLAGMGFAWVFYTQLRKKKDLSAFLEPIYALLSSLKLKKKKKNQMSYVSKYSSTYEDLVKKTIR
jgi:membrane associated rhomboid family serine protease